MYKKVILFAPYWVDEALQRQGLTVAALSDPVKIKGMLSPDDIRSVLSVDRTMRETYVDKDRLFGLEDLHAQNLQRHYPLEVQEDTNSYYSRNVYSVPMSTTDDDVKERLFTEEARLPRYENPFNIYDVTPELGVVVIYPGFFTPSNVNAPAQRALALSVVRAYLKQLYVHLPVNVVSTTKAFAAYLRWLK